MIRVVPEQLTPLHADIHGSVAFVQPERPVGQDAVVTAARRDSRPRICGDGLHTVPRSVPELETKLLFQEPGKAPHSAALPVATRRVRAAMPPGHEAGMLPLNVLAATLR